MADSLAKEVELPCSGNRDECHANPWLLGRLITFRVGISVAVALAWQSYGDIPRQIVATSCEQFSSIAPRAAPIVCNTSDMIAMAAQAAPSPDGQRLGATPLGLAGVPTRPPSRIGYQDVTAPIVRQEVVRAGFRAHVPTDSPKWSACRYRIQMMRILHIPIHPPPKFRRHGWWTATAVHHSQTPPAKTLKRTPTTPAQIDSR